MENYRIRPARGDEVEAMQTIDIASSQLFVGTGLIDFGPSDCEIEPIPEAVIRKAFAEGLAIVIADDRDCPVGFVLCTSREDELYIDQISVLPDHGRQGLGGRLIDKIIEMATEGQYKRISLSTFRHVPWNGPFYKKKGFKEIPFRKLTVWQLDLHERQKATMDVAKRCFMQHKIKRGWW